MRQLIFPFFVLLLCQTCPAQQKNNEPVWKITDSSYYKTKYLDSTQYMNGLKHGRSVLYKNDVLYRTQEWEGGKLNGKSVMYSSGFIQQIDYFNGGVNVDTTYIYRMTPVYFIASKHTYYPNGWTKLKMEYYQDGQMHTQLFCNPRSGYDSIFNYYPGNRIKRESRDIDKIVDPSGQTGGWNAIRNYHPSGKLQSSGIENSHSKEGEWTYYDTSGLLLSRINYAHNEPHGWFTSYYPDSTVQLRTFCYKAYTDTITVYNSDGIEVSRYDSLYNATIEAQQRLYYGIHFRNPNRFSPRNLYNRDDSVWVSIMPEGGLPITKPASFPGGLDSLNAFYRRNTVYPEPEKAALLEGVVFIEFVVQADGTITDVFGHGGPQDNWGLEKEALRVFRLMPKWIPAQYNGKNVKSTLEIAVTFYII